VGNFIVQDKWKTKNKMGECRPEGLSQIPGIRGWRRQHTRERIMETSSAGGQGPEGAVVPQMDGFKCSQNFVERKLSVRFSQQCCLRFK